MYQKPQLMLLHVVQWVRALEEQPGRTLLVPHALT